jgi:carboxylesterase
MNDELFNPEFDSKAFLLKGSSTGIVLFHGFTATPLEIRGLADEIQSRLGWTVYAPLLSGHGTSPQDLAHTHSTEWLQCAEEALDTLKTSTSQWYVGGESMGGLLALYLMAVHPKITAGAVFAPALRIPGVLKARLLKDLIFGSPKRHLEPTKDGFLPWQGYRINPLSAVAELGSLQEAVKPRLPEIRQPLLIFQGKQDETIDHRSASMVYNAVSSREKQLIEPDNCGHCVLLNNQYKLFFVETTDFLLKHPGICG